MAGAPNQVRPHRWLPGEQGCRMVVMVPRRADDLLGVSDSCHVMVSQRDGVLGRAPEVPRVSFLCLFHKSTANTGPTQGLSSW